MADHMESAGRFRAELSDLIKDFAEELPIRVIITVLENKTQELENLMDRLL